MITKIKKWKWYAMRTPFKYVVKNIFKLFKPLDILKRNKVFKKIVFSENEISKASKLNKDGFVYLDQEINKSTIEKILLNIQEKQTNLGAIKEVQLERRKDFWTRYLDKDVLEGNFNIYNPFLELALSKPIINIVSSSLGEVPILESVQVFHSIGTGDMPKESQLWHRDYDDTRVLKLQIYLSPVLDKDSGPFNFIDGPTSDNFGSMLKTRIDDESKISNYSKHEVLGDTSKAILIETSRCLHMGGRLKKDHERILYTATYVSFPFLHEKDYSHYQSTLTGNESELEKSILYFSKSR